MAWILCIYIRGPNSRIPLIPLVTLGSQTTLKAAPGAAAGMWIKFPGNGRVDWWNPHDASENDVPLVCQGKGLWWVARKGLYIFLSEGFPWIEVDQEKCVRQIDSLFLWLKSVFNFAWQDIRDTDMYAGWLQIAGCWASDICGIASTTEKKTSLLPQTRTSWFSTQNQGPIGVTLLRKPF